MVFRFVVEEFARGADLADRQGLNGIADPQNATGQLASAHSGLCHHGVTFCESRFQCGFQFIGRFHLGNAQAASALVGLHENGKSKSRDLLFWQGNTRAQKHRWRDRKAPLAQEGRSRKFAEGEGHVQDIAGLVRDLQHIQIALQFSILTGWAMDGDQRGIEALRARPTSPR